MDLGIVITPIKLTVPVDTSKFYQPIRKNTATPNTPDQKNQAFQTTPKTTNPSSNNKHSKRPNQVLPRPPANYQAKVSELIRRLKRLKHCTDIGKFYPDHDHAKKFAKDYKSILGTLRFRKGFDANDWQDQIKMTKKSATPRTLTLFGAPGATKTTSLLKIIKELGLEQLACGLTVICPRTDQHTDWMNKLDPKYDYSVKTFETPFDQPVADVVVVEELGQTPSAWLDCLLYTRPNIKTLILLGDFKQNVHYESNPNSISRKVIPTIDRLMVSHNLNYLNESFRLAPNQCDKLNIICRVKRPPLLVSTTYNLDPTIPVLASSDSRATKLTRSGYSDVYTYPGAQGADFKDKSGKHIPYALQINKDCLSMSERCWFTATTRSNVEIFLWIEDKKILDELWISSQDKPSLRALLEMLHETEQGDRVDLTMAKGANFLGPMVQLRGPEAVIDACYTLHQQTINNRDLQQAHKNFRSGFSRNFKFEHPSDREISALLHLLRIDAVVGQHATPRSYHTHRFLLTGDGYKFVALS